MNSTKKRRGRRADDNRETRAEKSPREERFDIGVRAYVVAPGNRRPDPYRDPAPPSEWSLAFDTETTVDAAQNLRFGAYQVYQDLAQVRKGLFFNPAFLNHDEHVTLRRYAKKHGLELRSVSDFIENIFFVYGYDFRASIIGFNLPFDLSRLAYDYDTARVSEARRDLGMRGGFTFQLSRKWWRPRVRIKRESRRLAFMHFTSPSDPNAPRSALKDKKRGPVRRGFFVDLKTLGDALTSEFHDLDSLATFLGATNKVHGAEHGKTLTDEYIDYAIGDVETTWQCFVALSHRFETHRLRQTLLHSIYSEASLGKAYLRQMGIVPWQRTQPNFPAKIIGLIMSTYYGGRAEVHIRRQITQVFYCDFRSMYPSVCTLMRLWEFVVADGMEYSDSTSKIRRLLRDVTMADLQKPEFWPSLRVIVQVRPDCDIFPTRARYEGTQFNIGVNYLTSEFPLWFTLADCIASKLLTGKTPKISKALSFAPRRPQRMLSRVPILGNPNYVIDPATDDFYRSLIDLRAEVSARAEKSEPAEAEKLEVEAQAIKILANATSYGIFVELNIEELAAKQRMTRYGASGKGVTVASLKREKPGRYFHPLLGTLITGAARLMLAITETLVRAEGLDWGFCDTDSMALANSSDLPRAEFFARAQRVCNWFDPLNPYEAKGALLEVEDENWKLADGRITATLEPLFCYAISAKRYVLFNIDANGKPVLRKGLAHGLGHLYRPYEDGSAPKEFPAPVVTPAQLGVNRWQHDLWYRIIVAAMAEHTDSNPAAHAAFEGPAASRYHATTPEILGWFKHYNDGRSFAKQVKPFNFMLSFQARPVTEELWDPKHSEASERRRHRTRLPEYPRPVAAYDRDPRKAASHCFDRQTGKPVPFEFLQTYGEALAQYHLHAEAKFVNGNARDQGITERRRVRINAGDIHYIGKEANELEEQVALGAKPEEVPEYGTEGDAYRTLLRQVREGLRTLGPEDVSRISKVSERYVRAVRDGLRKPTLAALRKIEVALSTLRNRLEHERELFQWARDYDKVSRREFARQLNEDRRNLDKVFSGKRRLTQELLNKLRNYRFQRGDR